MRRGANTGGLVAPGWVYARCNSISQVPFVKLLVSIIEAYGSYVVLLLSLSKNLNTS